MLNPSQNSPTERAYEPASENIRRDRVAKFQLYGKHRVGEYWLIDKDKQAVEIYRLHGDTLELTEVLTGDDELTTPVLPSFACLASQVFAMPPLFNG